MILKLSQPWRLLASAAFAAGLALPLTTLGDEPTAAPETRVYIVQMREPAAIAAQSSRTQANRALLRGRTPHGRFDAHSAAVHTYGARLIATHDQLLEAVGAPTAKLYSYRLAFNGFAARLTARQAAELRARPEVKRVSEDHSKRLRTDSSPGFLGLLDASGGLQAARGLKGDNVVIGVIDSGITPGHPSFSDQAEKPPPRLCRSDWAKNSLLGRWLCARFKKPRMHTVYAAPDPEKWNGTCQAGDGFADTDCNNKLIGARFYNQGFELLYGTKEQGGMDQNEFLSPRDADGHGTHIASIAAGNRVRASLGGTAVATVSGMAPRARIAVYKACWLEPGATRASCAMSDLVAAIEDAINDGVDIINYAVGTTTGGPADDDALSLLAAADAGVLAVVAAGNGGPDQGTIESPGSSPWVLTVAASSRTGQRYDNVLRITAPASASGDFSAREAGFTPTLRSTGAVSGHLVLVDDGVPTTDSAESTRADACQDIANAAAIAGNIALIRRGMCTFQEKIQRAQAAGAIAAVIYNNVSGETIIMTGERGSVGIPAVMIGQGDGDFLVTRLGAGDAVAALLDKSLIATHADPGNVMYVRSARGPDVALPDVLKPDVTAPGVDILAAQTPDVANGVRGENFQYLSGTSMAVPHVAGVAALLREAHPDWSPAALRSALVTTARQNLLKEDGETPADAFDFGGGHIVPDSAVDPGLVYEANYDDYGAFACGAGIAAADEDADYCAQLAAEGYSLAPDDLNLPTITVSSLVGERTIHRRITNVGPPGTYEATINPPPGTSASVSPAYLTLGTGETAEFTVTFTNLGDPGRLDTWNEGELIWADGDHRVRSPIVVAPAALAAPAAVSATGTSGATSFDVTFGYDGGYFALAAGLEAPVRFQGSVIDDPLNSYQIYSDDELHDYIRRFRITVEPGTRYLRVVTASTDENSADDIDLYLLCPGGLCPNGEQALASTGPTSDEVVDILDPAPGEYTIDVHGYEVNSEDGVANFELAAWTLAEGTGEGSFMVQSAPAAAVTGLTDAVNLSWQDLQPGDVYLGLVTHSNGSEDLGYTLVEVLTP